jgi:protein lysine acetyltransferase
MPLMEGVGAERLNEIAALMWRVRGDPGEVLVREGEPGDTFGLVLEGQVRVSLESAHGPRLLADAQVGAILGELAVLRHQPRTATLTALTPVVLAMGGAAALELMLDIPEVRDRVRRLASTRLARDLRPVHASLADGTPIVVRPLLAEDRAVFDSELHRLSEVSLRRRFFSPASPTESMVDYLVHIDYVDHFAWVVLDSDNHSQGLATARFVRLAQRDRAEMAFGTADRYQGRGIGTFLFGAVGVAAVEAGIAKLVGHVLEDNKAMRAVFAKVDCTTQFDEPGVLLVETESAAAAALLPDAIRDELAAAVHDIVTAASLALSLPAIALRHGPRA